MRVVEVTADLQSAWNGFVQGSTLGSFLQSWEWGEMQKAAGFSITRLVVADSASAIVPSPAAWHAVCLLSARPLPLRRRFLYAPYGPVLRSADAVSGVLSVLTDALREQLRQRGAVFARVEPKLPAGEQSAAALRSRGFELLGRGLQPKDTLVLDLTPSEDDLLRAVHPKWRYNIRVARRQGVTVRESTDVAGLRVFLALARAVERRGQFHYHPGAHYDAMLRVLAPAGMLTILIAEYQNLPLAAHLLIRFGDTVWYAHGASNFQKRSVMAPHLLQWEGIIRAKGAGAARFDLFGIAPPGSGVAHPWFGITRFKRGFGGREEHTVGAADLIGDRALYRAYEVGRSLRSLLR